MEDEQFKRTLQALAGDAGDWEDFDPSSWRPIKAGGGEEAESGVPAAQEGDAWDSDDSAAMVLNWHKLSSAERNQIRGHKLNKAREFAATEPAVLRDAVELEKVTWNETGLAMGEVSPTGATFVPWRLVVGYPDMYIGKRNSERAAPLFTLEALHENRVWDLYYIHRPQPTDKKPVVFVPTYQFQHLLDVVNAKLETQLTIPPGSNEEKFNMSFGIGNCPRPRFLGRSTSLESFENLCNAIPVPDPGDNLENATQRGREQFLRNIRMTDTARSKKKKSDKNRVKRIMAHKAWGRSIKRVQRYLGLRQRATDGTDPSIDTPRVLDLSLPMAQKPKGSVVFMAIDVEAWEQNQKVATEVGMALLDTADLQGVAPGDGGRNWFSLIQARHFRIKENLWALNKRYVQGYPERFNFGMSEFIEVSAVAAVVKRLIEGGSFVDKFEGAAEQRHVVLVFHESSADMKYLGELGYDVSSAKNIVEVVDTKEMHQCVVRSKNSSSLGSVLGSLQIHHKYLHNAGNDAVYTLQAMIGLAVKKRLDSLENAAKDNQQPIPFSELKEQEGWTSGGEDSDGGDAVNPFNPQADWEDEDGGNQAW